MAKKTFWGVVAGGLAATALAGAVALAPAAAAAAAAAQPVSGQAVSATSAAGATPKYCARIDQALTRRQQVRTRLAGDANTRGSIAWLQARSQSLATGNPELSKLLADLAARRSQATDPAATIIADLQAVKQAHCG